jgi:hypothetical protein
MTDGLTITHRKGMLKPPHFVGLLLAALVGCSKSDDGRIEVYPVTGRVTVNGEPAAGAEVVLYGTTPEFKGSNVAPPEGTTDENGEFQLRTYDPDDGAPAGKFNVSVIWPEPIPAGVDTEMYQPADRLKGKYTNPDASGLTVEVPVGGGTLPPIELN